MSRHFAACLLLLAAFSAACGGGSTVDLPPAPANVPAPAGAPASPTPSEPERVYLQWGPGWTVRVRPFFSGQPLNDGIGTVVVDAWTNGPAKVTYDFPKVDFLRTDKQVSAMSKGALRHEPASGTITIDDRSRTAPVFTPPALWPGGQSASPGPLLWLPPAVLADLKAKKTAKLDLEPLPQGLLMETEPSKLSGPATLSYTGADLLGLMVNGQRMWLPVIKATDDRKCEYIILDSPEGPLVMRFKLGDDAEVAGRRLKTGVNSGYDVMSLDRRAVDAGR
jgi:hypothetical protein